MAVGYTADAYIIKNSWGTSWGLDGYALISRTDSGNCKILNQGHIVNKPAFEWKMLTSFFILAIILMLSWLKINKINNIINNYKFMRTIKYIIKLFILLINFPKYKTINIKLIKIFLIEWIAL